MPTCLNTLCQGERGCISSACKKFWIQSKICLKFQIPIYALFGKLWATYMLFWAQNAQKQCFMGKICTITWWCILYITLNWICKFAITHICHKLANTCLTQFVRAFLRWVKGYYFLPPWFEPKPLQFNAMSTWLAYPKTVCVNWGRGGTSLFLVDRSCCLKPCVTARRGRGLTARKGRG